MKRKPSLKPQRLSKGCWYYENERSIDVYIYTGVAAVTTRIPASMLRASLRRMVPTTRRKKTP